MAESGETDGSGWMMSLLHVTIYLYLYLYLSIYLSIYLYTVYATNHQPSTITQSPSCLVGISPALGISEVLDAAVEELTKAVPQAPHCLQKRAMN